MADRRALLFTIDSRVHGQITAWLAGTEVGRPTLRSSDQPHIGEPVAHEDGDSKRPVAIRNQWAAGIRAAFRPDAATAARPCRRCPDLSPTGAAALSPTGTDRVA